jgi:hypothetical protein
MSVASSIICAKINTARATPSMRPASSSNCCVSMLLSVWVVAMHKLCSSQSAFARAKLDFCLEAHFVPGAEAFQ